MKKLVSMLLAACTLLSCGAFASAAGEAEEGNPPFKMLHGEYYYNPEVEQVEEQANGARITRVVNVSSAFDKETTLGTKKITISVILTSTVHVNDTNNDISYFAPVKLKIVNGLPNGVTVQGSYWSGEAEYDSDEKGSAERRGTLTLKKDGQLYPVQINAKATVVNGKVVFGGW